MQVYCGTISSCRGSSSSSVCDATGSNRWRLVLSPVHAFLSSSLSPPLSSPLSSLVAFSVRSFCVSGVIGSVPFGLNGLGPHTGGFSADGSFLSSLCILLFIYHLITLRPDLAFNLLVACVLCVSSVIGSVPFGLNGLGPHIGGFSTDGSFLSTPIHLPYTLFHPLLI